MVNELPAVIAELGGESSVGRAVHSTEDMSRAIREGFPHPVVKAFVKASGLTLQEVASSLDLSVRSLQRRRHQGRLARFESDRLYRLARLMVLADYFLGDHAQAIAWFRRPKNVLGVLSRLRSWIRSSERVRLRAFSGGLGTAASVDHGLPAAVEAVFRKPF